MQKQDLDDMNESNDDIIDDIQGASQNNEQERPDDGKSSALNLDYCQGASTDLVKAVSLDTPFLLKKISKAEDDTNDGMVNCNEIERTIMPILKRSQIIRDNIERETHIRGEKAMIYEMANIISSMSSAFLTTTGYIKNIRFALGRVQDTLIDLKERIKGEEDE